jgi:hypothetical protein
LDEEELATSILSEEYIFILGLVGAHKNFIPNIDILATFLNMLTLISNSEYPEHIER